MDPRRFEEHLRCPACGGALRREGGEMACAAGGHRYGMHGDVPILLEPADRAALAPAIEAAAQMVSEFRPGLRRSVLPWVKRAIGSTWRQRPTPAVARALGNPGGGLRLEVGSGTRGSSPDQVNLDVAPFPGVDVVATGTRIPFREGTFDLVQCLAVLEHVREPERVVAEIRRVLRPGGTVYAEVPFLQHFHAYPDDFRRFTEAGFRLLFREFEIVESGVCVGPSSTLTAIAADWVELLTFSRRRWVNDLARTIPLVLLWPLKYADVLLLRNPRAHEIASGVFVLARRPGEKA